MSYAAIHPDWEKPRRNMVDGYSLEMTAKELNGLREAAPLILVGAVTGFLSGGTSFSLDTLDPARFQAITRWGRLDQVLGAAQSSITLDDNLSIGDIVDLASQNGGEYTQID